MGHFLNSTQEPSQSLVRAWVHSQISVNGKQHVHAPTSSSHHFHCAYLRFWHSTSGDSEARPADTEAASISPCSFKKASHMTSPLQCARSATPKSVPSARQHEACGVRRH